MLYPNTCFFNCLSSYCTSYVILIGIIPKIIIMISSNIVDVIGGFHSSNNISKELLEQPQCQQFGVFF